MLDESAAMERARRAEKERERYRKRRRLWIDENMGKRARLGRTLQEETPAAIHEPNQLPGSSTCSRKRKKVATLMPSMRASIDRIAVSREFKRQDILGGEQLSKIEFNELRQDNDELRKFFAMDFYLRLRGKGTLSRNAYQAAADTLF